MIDLGYDPVNLEYDPRERRSCRICKVALGEPCVSLSGKIVNGRPDGVRTILPRPHTGREPRTYGRRGFHAANPGL